MTDVSPTPDVPAAPVESAPVPVDATPAPVETPAPAPSKYAAEIAAIHADIEAEGVATAAAAKTESDRVDALDAAKARCDAECGEVQAAVAEATDPRARQALIELEARVHAAHADDLAAAYRAFSGQTEGESNPAPAGGTTPITAAVAVNTEAGA